MDFVKNLQNTVTELQSMASEMVDGWTENEPVGNKPAPVTRKVLVVIYNPRVASEGNKPLREVMGWNDPDQLTRQHISDLAEASHGYANYQVVERVEVDKVPVKADGFAYNPDDLVKLLRTNQGFHKPDEVSYNHILADFNIPARVNNGSVDEVWLFAFPYGGFYESMMGGPGAFWCNAPVMPGAEAATRRFVIMGYNYQRGPGEMLENMGHRTESILEHVFRHKSGADNLWKRFAQYDKTHPGQAEVGVMHFAPNSEKDYDWGNKRRVASRAHTWSNFPNLAGEGRIVDTAEWGGGEIRAHHLWWFKYLPHITGGAGGIAYNWWRYIIDPNTVR